MALPFTTRAYTVAEFFARYPTPPGELEQYLSAGAEGMIVAVEEETAEGTRLWGYWPIWYAAHIDGVWFDPAMKQVHPAAPRSLLEGVFATLRHNGVPQVFAVLTPESPIDQADRLGFTRAPGDLHLLRVP
jgi:hypothetical protein